MSQLLQTLQSLFTPEQLSDLSRVREELIKNPESLDTHSREARTQEKQNG